MLNCQKGQDVMGKLWISTVFQTVKLPSICEPLFLIRVQEVLLSGGNTPWMSHQFITLIISSNTRRQAAPRGGETVPPQFRASRAWFRASRVWFRVSRARFRDHQSWCRVSGVWFRDCSHTPKEHKGVPSTFPAGAGKTVHTVSLC